MAGMRSDDGLIFVIGGGQYVNIKGEDRGGEEYIDLVFTNADAFRLGQLLIQESGLQEEPKPPVKIEGDVVGHIEDFDEKTGMVTFRLDDGTAQKLGLRQTTGFSIYTKAD